VFGPLEIKGAWEEGRQVKKRGVFVAVQKNCLNRREEETGEKLAQKKGKKEKKEGGKTDLGKVFYAAAWG